jgi:hypothetical protein
MATSRRCQCVHSRASNGRTVDEWRTGKHLEGSRCSWIDVLLRYFSLVGLRNIAKTLCQDSRCPGRTQRTRFHIFSPYDGSKARFRNSVSLWRETDAAECPHQVTVPASQHRRVVWSCISHACPTYPASSACRPETARVLLSQSGDRTAFVSSLSTPPALPAAQKRRGFSSHNLETGRLSFLCWVHRAICIEPAIHNKPAPPPLITILWKSEKYNCRSQWPRGLRSNTGIVGSNPTWGMDVCVRLLCLCCPVLVAALWRADPPSKESYRLCKRSRNWKSGQGPTKGCTGTDTQSHNYPEFN